MTIFLFPSKKVVICNNQSGYGISHLATLSVCVCVLDPTNWIINHRTEEEVRTPKRGEEEEEKMNAIYPSIDG